jgi:hypothetical protein
VVRRTQEILCLSSISAAAPGLHLDESYTAIRTHTFVSMVSDALKDAEMSSSIVPSMYISYFWRLPAALAAACQCVGSKSG